MGLIFRTGIRAVLHDGVLSLYDLINTSGSVRSGLQNFASDQRTDHGTILTTHKLMEPEWSEEGRPYLAFVVYRSRENEGCKARIREISGIHGPNYSHGGGAYLKITDDDEGQRPFAHTPRCLSRRVPDKGAFCFPAHKTPSA